MTESVGVEAEMLMMKRRPDSLTRHAPIFNHHHTPTQSASSRNGKEIAAADQQHNQAIRSFVKYGDSEFLLTRIPQNHPADEEGARQYNNNNNSHNPLPPTATTSIPFDLECANSVEANAISTTAPPSPTHHLVHGTGGAGVPSHHQHRDNSPVVDFHPTTTYDDENLHHHSFPTTTSTHSHYNPTPPPPPPVYRALLVDEEDLLSDSDHHQHQHHGNQGRAKPHLSSSDDEPSIVPPAKQTPLKPNDCGSYYSSRSPSMNNLHQPHVMSFRRSQLASNNNSINTSSAVVGTTITTNHNQTTTRSRTPIAGQPHPHLERRSSLSSAAALNSSTLYKSRRSSVSVNRGRYIMPGTMDSHNISITTTTNPPVPPPTSSSLLSMPPPPSLSDVFYLDRYAVGRVNQTTHLNNKKKVTTTTTTSRPSSPFTASNNNNTLDLLYDELVRHNNNTNNKNGNTPSTRTTDQQTMIVDKKAPLSTTTKRKPSISVVTKKNNARSTRSSIITASTATLHQQPKLRRNSAALQPPLHSSKVAPLRLPFLEQKGGIYDVPIEIYIPLKRQPSVVSSESTSKQQRSQQEQEILNSQIYFVESGPSTKNNMGGQQQEEGRSRARTSVVRSSLKPPSIDRRGGGTPTSKRGSAHPSPRGGCNTIRNNTNANDFAIHPTSCTSSTPPKVQPNGPPPTSRGNRSIPSPTPLLSPIHHSNNGNRGRQGENGSPTSSMNSPKNNDTKSNNGTDHSVPCRPPSLRQSKRGDVGSKKTASPTTASTTPHGQPHQSPHMAAFNLMSSSSSGRHNSSSPSPSGDGNKDGVTPSWIQTLNDSGSPFQPSSPSPSSPLARSQLQKDTTTPASPVKRNGVAATTPANRLVESEAESSCSPSPRLVSKNKAVVPSPQHHQAPPPTKPTTASSAAKAPASNTTTVAPKPSAKSAATPAAGTKIVPKSSAIRRMSLIKHLKASDSDSDSTDDNHQHDIVKSQTEPSASPSRARSTHVHNPTERADVGMSLHRLQSADEFHA